jgi:multiple sugar transport system substrate-binding protein
MGRHAVVLVIITALSLNGCKDHSGNAADSAGSNITITFWSSTYSLELEHAKEVAAEWNAAKPNIYVKVEPVPAGQSSEEVLLAAIAGGTTPDIYCNAWAGGINRHVEAGALINLDRFDDFHEFVDRRVSEGTKETMTASDGHYYHIPWKINPIMIVYNPDMFEKAGITTLPRTYSEYYEAAERLTIDTDGDGKIDQWMGTGGLQPIWWHRLFDFYCMYIAASGGRTLLTADGRVNFNNQAAVSTMEFFRTMFSRGYYPHSQFQINPFLTGKSATLITGCWHMSYLDRYKPEDLNYDVMRLPVPDDYDQDKYYTYGDVKFITIFSTARHPSETWEFMKFYLSKEADLRILELSQQIPVRKNITQNEMFIPYFQSNPRMEQFAELLPYCRDLDTDSSLKEILDGLSQEYEACAIYNTKTSQQAIQDAVKRAEVIIKWNAK